MGGIAIKTLAVFGVGLIGASFALALKRAGQVGRVIGVGRSRANLERALARGAIDEIAADARTALSHADLVLVAVPVQQTERVLSEIAPWIAPDAIVTDAGSTKQDVVAAARRAMGEAIDRFVPAHPIAGAESSGADAAIASLYENRLVVITPLAQNKATSVDRVRAVWQACGARVVQMQPKRHDEILAAVSHLPHALAFALVDMIARRPDGESLLSYAGAGFRDFTRIAGSSPEMWRDICMANASALLAELAAYQRALDALAGYIRSGDAAALEALFVSARDARTRWLAAK
ncbi:MAG TPA: prephenate dehydrogenase/arogenate dehydrogenase family protein [Burkholderiales bacterium]|nr:prephenate dehydrogenase/arogenate dehydrogenase family protein [Burkholderiales bacterium]